MSHLELKISGYIDRRGDEVSLTLSRPHDHEKRSVKINLNGGQHEILASGESHGNTDAIGVFQWLLGDEEWMQKI